MQGIIFFIKKHWLAWLLAFIVGLILVASTLLSIHALGDQYKGVIYSSSDDDYTYLARAQEILDGHSLVGSAFYYEYKQFQPLLFPIGEYFYALPAFLFNVSLVSVLIFAKFLFPAILFLLIYFLVYFLSQGEDGFLKKFYASAVGIFITLGYNLIDYKFAWQVISGQAPSFHQILWTRPVNPITGAILIFAFLLLIWRLTKKSSYLLSFFTGLILGAMIYYFFSWGITVSFLAVFSLVFLIKKKLKIFLNLGIVFLSSLLPIFYFWFNSFDSISDKSALAKNGMFFTHAPMFNKFVVASLIIFIPCFLWRYYKSKKESQELPVWWWFCLSLLVSSAVAYNQQIITGRTIWPYHFVQYTIPFCIVAVMVLYYNFVRPKIGKLWIFLPLVIIFLSFGVSSMIALSYKYNLDDYRAVQKNAVVFDWVKNNAPKDCAILTLGGRLECFIPAFTQCNDYIANWNFSGVPPERVVHNYLVSLKIKGISDKQIDKYLSDNQLEVGSIFFTDWNMMFGHYIDRPFMEKTISELSAQYKEFYQANFAAKLREYRLDYFMSVGSLRQDLIDQLPGLKLVRQDSNTFIYSFGD